MSTKEVKPQMVIRETLGRTKKLIHKTFENLKRSLRLVKLQERPGSRSTLSDGKRDDNNNSKSEDVDDGLCGGYSVKQDADAIEVHEKKKIKEGGIPSKLQTKNDEKNSARSKSFSGCRGLEGLNEDKNASTRYVKRPTELSFRGADALVQKMKDLAMMEVHDIDQALDVEEVLHYYSRLKCPSYVEIVDNFFKDIYLDSLGPKGQSSRSDSMGRLSRASAHSSMRSLGPLKPFSNES